MPVAALVLYIRVPMPAVDSIVTFAAALGRIFSSDLRIAAEGRLNTLIWHGPHDGGAMYLGGWSVLICVVLECAGWVVFWPELLIPRFGVALGMDPYTNHLRTIR
jgi:hypothetical protein